MIVFDLQCPQDHVFEAWFASSTDYENQLARGLVECPLCGAQDLVKAAMAPHIPAKASRDGAAMLPVNPQAMKELLAAMAVAQKKILEGSDFVGDRFAEEARAIHVGEAEKRTIHGKATHEQTASLIEDGVPVSTLPFPVVEPGREN